MSKREKRFYPLHDHVLSSVYLSKKERREELFERETVLTKV